HVHAVPLPFREVPPQTPRCRCRSNRRHRQIRRHWARGPDPRLHGLQVHRKSVWLRMKKWLPWLILLLFVGYLAGQFRSPKTGEWDWQAFGKLPVMSNGRFQPIDSLARNSLLQLREKSSALNSTDPAVSAR